MIAWGSTAVVFGIVVAAVVVIVAVSGDSEPANVSIKCSVSDSDGSTAFSIQGKVTQKESEEGCDQLAAKLSGPNSYWRIGLPEPPPTYPEIVCGLNAPKDEHGTAIVEVNPESFSSAGTRICGSLTHEGWTQFTHGGVEGPWQAEAFERERQEAAKIEEEKIAESEAEEIAIYACEERAEAKEATELEMIERETEEEAVAAEPNEEKHYAIEEAGYEREEETYEREFEAQEICEETGGEAEGKTEVR
jgi:hypothetical protein